MSSVSEQVKKLEVSTKDICAEHIGEPIGKCPYCQIDELVTKCIQKNSEYQVALKMAQTYKDAAIGNSLMRSESLSLYWMNKAINLQEQLTRAQRSEKGIREEAKSYRDDYVKMVNWLCDNGFGDNYGNPTDDAIQLLNLAKEKDFTLVAAKKKILSLAEYATWMGNEMLRRTRNGNYCGDFVAQQKELLERIDKSLY